jgi:hypothetical protein
MPDKPPIDLNELRERILQSKKDKEGGAKEETAEERQQRISTEGDDEAQGPSIDSIREAIRKADKDKGSK